jgi:hypothetical protein
MLEHAHTIVGHAVKEQDPVAAGLRRPHFPPAKNAAIGGSHIELFAMRMVLGKRDIRLLYKVRRQTAPHGMQEPWRNQPPCCRCDERRKNKQLQKEADRAAHSLEDTSKFPQKFLVFKSLLLNQ